MKRISFGLMATALSLALAGCGGTPVSPAASNEPSAPSVPQTSASMEPSPAETQTGEISIALTVNGLEFAATLLDNEAAQELAELLPLTLDMSELNGNEKFFYLDSGLTANAQRPGQIHAGDLMLFGDSCLVLFYDSFSSGYSYTPLGRVDDPAGLADALGPGGVTVAFSLLG